MVYKDVVMNVLAEVRCILKNAFNLDGGKEKSAD